MTTPSPTPPAAELDEARRTLLDLADRVEKAEGPDRELQHAVLAAATDFRVIHHGYYEMGDRYYSDYGDEVNPALPDPLTSLDAALTLVPEGFGIELSRYWTDQGEGWSAYVSWGVQGYHSDSGVCASGALAITTAALRARAALDAVRKGGA